MLCLLVAERLKRVVTRAYRIKINANVILLYSSPLLTSSFLVWYKAWSYRSCTPVIPQVIPRISGLFFNESFSIHLLIFLDRFLPYRAMEHCALLSIYYYKPRSPRHVATDTRIILEIFKPRQLFLGRQLYISLVLVKSVLVFFFFFSFLSFQLKVFFSTARYNFFQCKLFQVVRAVLRSTFAPIELNYVSSPSPAFFRSPVSPAVYRISVHFQRQFIHPRRERVLTVNKSICTKLERNTTRLI